MQLFVIKDDEHEKEKLAYSAWVWLTAGICGDVRDRLRDGEACRVNVEAGGGIKGSLDRPKKRLNL